MQLSDVEKFVLMSLDHVGRYSSLWFPEVQREALNFPAEPVDAEVQAVLFRLIQAGWVEIRKGEGEASVRIDPTPDVLGDIRANPETVYELELSQSARQALHAALDRGKVAVRGHFELFAHGKSFDVDAYLKTARLEFDRVWSHAEDRYRTNGVGKLLGDGAAVPLDQQQQMAVEFLSANRVSLQALARFPGVETFILGQQVNIELKDGLLGFCVAPSAALMRLVLEIGVRPTFYVVLKRPGEPPARGFSKDLFLEGW